MNRINQLEVEIARALDRLRLAMVRDGGSGNGASSGSAGQLEKDRARLAEQLENLRTKRDKDVAALDELISQLKPLIEEA